MRRLRALTICTEKRKQKQEFRGDFNDIEQFIPAECFAEKVKPSEIYIISFLAFTGIPENFCSICPQLSVPGYFWEVDNNAQDK